MRFLSALLLGAAASLDNLLIGFCIYLRGGKVTTFFNLSLALCSGASAFLLCRSAGHLALLSRIAEPMGGLFLILFGLLPLVWETPTSLSERVPDRSPAPLETLLLSFLVSLNCLPVSFAAGLAGHTPFEITASVTLFSLFFVRLGAWWGQMSGSKVPEETLTLLSCLLLFLLGTLELLL